MWSASTVLAGCQQQVVPTWHFKFPSAQAEEHLTKTTREVALAAGEKANAPIYSDVQHT